MQVLQPLAALALCLSLLAADRPPPPGPEQPPPAAVPQDLQGVWTVAHADYAGHVIVVKRDKGYQLKWILLADARLNTPFGQVPCKRTLVYDGYAERKGDLLTAAWSAEGALGLSHYRILGGTIAGNGETWRPLPLEVDHGGPAAGAGPDRGERGSWPEPAPYGFVPPKMP